MVTKLIGLAVALAILAVAGLWQPALAQGVEAAVAIEVDDYAGAPGQAAVDAFEPASRITDASVTHAPAPPSEPGVGTVQMTHDHFGCLWRYWYNLILYIKCFYYHYYT